MSFHSSSFAAQLFSEISLRTLLPVTTSSSPSLPKLLSAVEQYRPPTPALSSAAHVLSLRLLHTILIKMDASGELRGSAVAALCKAAHSYAHTEGEDTPVRPSVAFNKILVCFLFVGSMQPSDLLFRQPGPLSYSVGMVTDPRLSLPPAAAVSGGRHTATALFADIFWGEHRKGPQAKGEAMYTRACAL